MESRRSWGVLVLVTAAVLAFALFVRRGSAPLPTDPVGVTGTLISALLVVVGLLLLGAILLGVAPGAGGPANAGAGTARRGSRFAPLGRRVPVRRFRVRAMTGELVSCVQAGELLDDEIRHGEFVLVEGRRGRDGRLSVRRLEVREGPAGPTRRAVRTSGGHGVGVVVDRVYLVLGIALLAWTGIDLLRLVA